MKFFLHFLLFISLNTIAQVPPGYENDEGDLSGYGTGSYGGDLDRSDIHTGLTIVKEGNLYGINFKDSVVLKPQYDNIEKINWFYKLKKKGKYGLANFKGQLILPLEYDSIMANRYPQGNSVLINKKGKWGSLDKNGAILIAPKHKHILYSDEVNKYSLVKENKNDRPTLFYNDTKICKDADNITFYQNVAILRRDKKYGVFKGERNTVPFAYDSIYTGIAEYVDRQIKKTYVFNNRNSLVNNVIVKNNGKYGLISADGAVVFEPIYDMVQYKSKYYNITLNKKKGVYFEDSHKKTDVIYDEVRSEVSKYVTIINNNKLGLLDYKGAVVVPVEYDKITDINFKNGFLVVKNGKAGIMRDNGEMAVPLIYDDIIYFPRDLKNLYRVSLNKKWGVIDATGKRIIPTEYDFVYDIEGYLGVRKDNLFGLFTADGKMICKPEYKSFKRSVVRSENILYVEKGKYYGIVINNKLLYEPIFKEIDLIHDTNNLLYPSEWAEWGSKKNYLYVKTDTKFGVFDEVKRAMVIPVEYDSIVQKFVSGKNIYIAAKKGKNYGVLNSDNSVVVPFVYDYVNLSLVKANKNDLQTQIVAAKGNKFGAITLQNDIVIPFNYSDLQRLSSNLDLYKAKKGKFYSIINSDNKVLNAGPFDEVAQFEGTKALTFFNGTMRVVNSDGVFISSPVNIQPHKGYKTFNDLKFALIDALESKDDKKLQDFVNKVAPSNHILYFFKHNFFNKNELLNNVDQAYIKNKYFTKLHDFKWGEWNSAGYNKQSLISVTDFTLLKNGFVTNKRTEDHAYGSSRLMEKLLRDAIKVNGYWISTYFMTSDFDKR